MDADKVTLRLREEGLHGCLSLLWAHDAKEVLWKTKLGSVKNPAPGILILRGAACSRVCGLSTPSAGPRVTPPHPAPPGEGGVGMARLYILAHTGHCTGRRGTVYRHYVTSLYGQHGGHHYILAAATLTIVT